MKSHIITSTIFFTVGAASTLYLSELLHDQTREPAAARYFDVNQSAETHKGDKLSAHPKASNTDECTSKPLEQSIAKALTHDKAKKETPLNHQAQANNIQQKQWQKIKAQPGAGKALLSQYLDTTDAKARNDIAIMMRNLPEGEKLELTETLINEPNENDRRLAYSLLRKNPNAPMPAHIESSLVNNLYQESSAPALIDNLSAVRNIRSKDIDKHGLLTHIDQLAYHHDAGVRAEAISTLSYMDNSRDTLRLVLKSLDDNDPKVRRAAAGSLFNYEALRDADYSKLLEITSDFAEDLEVREEILAYLASNQD